MANEPTLPQPVAGLIDEVERIRKKLEKIRELNPDLLDDALLNGFKQTGAKVAEVIAQDARREMRMTRREVLQKTDLVRGTSAATGENKCQTLIVHVRTPSRDGSMVAAQPRPHERKTLTGSAMLSDAARDFAPHDVTFYLRELAASYHSYYDAERILVDDEAVRRARLALVAATAQVLHNGLAVLGVSAPQKM